MSLLDRLISLFSFCVRQVAAVVLDFQFFAGQFSRRGKGEGVRGAQRFLLFFGA